IHELTYNIKASMTETTRSVNNGTADVVLPFDKLDLELIQDGHPLTRIKGTDKALRDLRYLQCFLKEDRERIVVESKVDVSNVGPGSRSFLQDMGNKIQFAMKNVAVPIPNQQVQPGKQWAGGQFLAMGTADALQFAEIKTNYTYVGSRRRANRDEAVIASTGIVGAPGQNANNQLGGLGGGRQVPNAAKASGVAQGTAI